MSKSPSPKGYLLAEDLHERYHWRLGLQSPVSDASDTARLLYLVWHSMPSDHPEHGYWLTRPGCEIGE